MKIVFSLIWFIYYGSGSGAVKVGEYEKYSQCVQQGRAIAASNDWFKCVPVNATGTLQAWK
jgi:hypothetical protein